MVNSLSKSASLKVGALSLTLCLLAPAAANANDYSAADQKSPEATVSVIQAAVEAAGQDDAAPVLPDSETAEVISSSVEEGSVEVSRDGGQAEAVLDGGSDGIELTLGLPTPEYAEDAEVQDDGTAIYMDPEGVVDVGVQTLDDGSVRVLTVINDESAPGSYDYQIDVEDGVVLELTPEGAVALKGADGSSQGMILPAWAEDAAGNPVATHYEVSGNTVTQIVDHNAPGVVYPVVADPKVYYAWWQLFSWSEWRWNSAYRSNQLSMQLSAWGRHDVIFAAGQFVSSGWSLLKQKHPSWIFTASMRQQWECHVLGGIAEWGTFDLEYSRPSLPNWRKRIGMRPLSATCNW